MSTIRKKETQVNELSREKSGWEEYREKTQLKGFAKVAIKRSKLISISDNRVVLYIHHIFNRVLSAQVLADIKNDVRKITSYTEVSFTHEEPQKESRSQKIRNISKSLSKNEFVKKTLSLFNAKIINTSIQEKTKGEDC
jgi:hypothetical protein